MDIYQIVNPYRGLPFRLTVYDQYTDESLHFFPSHWHHYLEISATVSGKGKAVIDGTEYKIRNRNVFIIDPDVIHRIEGFEPYKENSGYCLQIDLSYFEMLMPDISCKYYPTCSEAVSNEIIQELDLLNKELKEQSSSFDLLIIILRILKILNEQKRPLSDSITDKNKNLVLHIADYIEKNFSEYMNVEILSSKFGYSQSYLQKIFKKYFHQSVYQYIIGRRLLHAIDDLKFTELSVLEIAMKNGFASSKSFINEFKRISDITPGEYRKKSGNSYD